MFVKIESERFSFLRQNQSKLRATDYTHLSELLADAAMPKNRIKAWTNSRKRKCTLEIGKFVVLPSTHIGSERYLRQKMYDIISISNMFRHPDIFLILTCNSKWPEIQNAHLPDQRADDRPDLCDRVFCMKMKVLMQYLRASQVFDEIISEVTVI